MFTSLLISRLQRLHWGQLVVTFPDGTSHTFGQAPWIGHLIIKDASAIRDIVTDTDTGFGDAYVNGRIEFNGDLHDIALMAARNADVLSPATFNWRHGFRLPTSVGRQYRDIHHHYDLGNDFFRLFLDPTMTYSCAYFKHPSDSLEQAQRQKIEHSLRKLRLQPGETLLDIGCGWGQLMFKAAETDGVIVDGLTLAEAQWAAVQRRIRDRALEGSVNVSLDGYRTFAGRWPGYDKLVSIGMMEHVGRPNLKVFLDQVAHFLKPGGLALLHCMTHLTETPASSWTTRYIFPGGYIPSLRELVALMPARNLHVLDVENLAPHYALTLDAWSENFERNLDQIAEVMSQPGRLPPGFGPARDPQRFIRMWRLYLRGAAAGFRSGSVEIHQMLVSHDLPLHLPLTRDDLYSLPARTEQPPLEDASVETLRTRRD